MFNNTYSPLPSPSSCASGYMLACWPHMHSLFIASIVHHTCQDKSLFDDEHSHADIMSRLLSLHLMKTLCATVKTSIFSLCLPCISCTNLSQYFHTRLLSHSTSHVWTIATTQFVHTSHHNYSLMISKCLARITTNQKNCIVTYDNWPLRTNIYESSRFLHVLITSKKTSRPHTQCKPIMPIRSTFNYIKTTLLFIYRVPGPSTVNNILTQILLTYMYLMMTFLLS